MPDIVYAGQRVTADLLTYRSPYVVAHASLVANSGTITSGTEVTVLTTGSATFTVGRAYRIEYHGLIQHATTSLTDLLFVRFRRTTGATLIRNVQSLGITNKATANRNNAIDVSTIVTPVATVTDTVYMTGSWDTGSAATFTFIGTAGTPGLLTITDVGPASDYPGIATF
ncbi:hypothetical protein [Streptomyces turgidiscabies]|uniref:hypothetical protein n=1 Tax=Streptomyces turgidiscabies TaxID=85558 RepID=UPI0038F5EEC5